MAEAVADAMAGGTHLLVQAGTGTGKSLAYLVPALLHDSRVVVATATLALQHQLVERDLPRLVEAVGDLPGVDASYAVLKGRSNYACLHRIRAGVPDDQGTLIEVPQGSMATKVLELRAWAEEEAEAHGAAASATTRRGTPTASGARSRSTTASASAPRSARSAQECFAELAREKAQRSHLVVTNHSLLAIDAIEGVPMIPDYDVVVVDEAHELVTRVTQAATDELFAADVDRAAKRSPAPRRGQRGRRPRRRRRRAAGRRSTSSSRAGSTSCPTRSATRWSRCATARAPASRPIPRATAASAATATPGSTQAKGAVQEVFATAERMAAHAESDVLWVTEAASSGPSQRPPHLVRRAPAGLGADARQAAHRQARGLHQRHPAAGRRLQRGGLQLRAQADARTSSAAVDGRSATTTCCPWRGLDVGSPFDYGQQAILYVARHLPPPGRDGLGAAQLDEIVELVDASEGRALGLFSSRRAAETAAEAVRERLPHLTTLAQGDAQLPELARQFVDDPHTALFGTLSLWQGLDVPGDTCQLVLIDRIPFPRPDDPLMSARQRAADRAGGNGFMQVAATHAALLLAQGTGRLIRTTTDRGVVAVLDPRLATARYGGFLKASLPPMWTTTDPAVVRKALARLAAAAESDAR